MVKVNSPYTGRTRPSGQGLDYVQVQYNPNHFGAAVGQALQGFSEALEVSRARKKENSRFDVLSGFTEFETSAKLQLERLKQETPEDAANYFEQAEAIFETARANYLNTVPADFQEEFAWRTEQVKQGVIFDAFKWDFEQQNLFYDQKINEALTQAQVALEQNPAQLEAQRAKVYDFIDSSGKTEIEKEQAKRLAAAALEAITYKNELKVARTKQLQGAGGIANRDLPPVAAGILAVIAKRESGGRYDIQYDGGSGSRIGSFVDHPRTYTTITSGPNKGKKSSASGRYQFIESTWDAAARGAGVSDFSPASQDAAAWYWAQKTFAEHTAGQKTLSQAVADGDWSTIKEALGSQWEGVKHMSEAEMAEAFAANSGVYSDISLVQNDPRFGNLDFATRQALEADAGREADAEYNALLEQRKQAREAEINALYTGLFDGTMGLSHINALRERGILTDYDDINKAHKVLDDRVKGIKDYARGEAMLTDGGIWVKENEDHKKAANALFEQGGGRAQLEALNGDYVAQTLLPRYDKMQMAAPEMVNMLEAMSRNANAASAAFAFETMRQMRERNEQAFNSQFPEAVQKQLDFWSLRRNHYSQEELVGQIQNRSTDQAARQAQMLLRADAQELLKEITVEDIQPLYESVIPWQSANVPISYRGRTLLEQEYKALFSDAFVQTGGNADEAKALADKQIMRVWHLSNIGGASRISRFPPEVAGYTPHNGSFDWIDRSVRAQLGLTPSQPFELIADETTELEIGKFRQAQGAGDRPSYLVMVEDKNGVRRLATDDDGDVLRLDFEIDRETLMEEDRAWRAEQERHDRMRIEGEYWRQKNLGSGPVDPVLEEEYLRVQEEKEREATEEYLREFEEVTRPVVVP